LGSQRKQIDKNDLPIVRDLMLKARFVLNNKPAEYKTEIRNLLNESDIKIPDSSVLFVSKKEILESKDAILSGEKYHNLRQVLESEYPLVKLKDLIKIQSGFAFDSKLFNEDIGFPLIRIRDIKTNSTKTKYTGDFKDEYIVRNGDLIIGMDGEFNCVIWKGNDAILNQRVCRITEYNNCLKEYIYKMLYKPLKEIENDTIAVTVKHISVKQIYEIEIPFPPIEVQQEIVDYFNACEQEIIDYKNMIAEKQFDIQNKISDLWGETQPESAV
jgi:restriction endonuclease S subunit